MGDDYEMYPVDMPGRYDDDRRGGDGYKDDYAVDDYGPDENFDHHGGGGRFNGGYRGRGGFRGDGFRGRGMPRGRGFPGPFRGRGGFPPRGGGFYGGPDRPDRADSQFGAFGTGGRYPHPSQQISQEERLKQLAGCEDGQDLWVETDAGDGKKYYYHAVNRNTVWELPENAKIIDQVELAQLVHRATEDEKAQGDPSAGNPGSNVDDAWSEFSAPDGRKYYFNSITQENTWEKPKSFVDSRPDVEEIDPAQTKAILEAQEKAKAALAEFMANQQAQRAAQAAAAEANGAPGVAAAVAAAPVAKPVERRDNSRPVSSTPVSGTPWCVVWTGDSRAFFYNPSTKTSVWDRPPETHGRADVDLLLSKPPEVKKDEPEHVAESDSDDDGQPKAKKSRSEKKREAALLAAQKRDQQEKPVRQMLEKPEDPAIKAEREAAAEREKIPHEERLAEFRSMLEEKDINTNSTFEKELSKIVFDKRYLLLGASERRACFDAFVRDKVEKDRAEKKKKQKAAKAKFQELLKEADLHGKSSFSSFASKNAKDSRFRAVDKMRDKEDMFNDYVGELYKKEKEEKKIRKEKQKADFIALLGEQEGLTRKSKWSTVKKTLENDERYIAIDSSSTREGYFRDFVDKLGDETASDVEEEKEREKRLAEEAAIQKRQKEVLAEREQQSHDINKESEKHRFNEHEDRFKALILDLIKTADLSWHEARRVLRKDNRYTQCDLLDKSQKESIFEDHIRSIERKRREAFFTTLDEHEKIDLNTRWKEAKKVIQDEEELFSKLVSNSEKRVEKDFRDWQERRHDQVVNEFKEMLKETKIITYKSKTQIDEGEQHLKDILAVLEKDNRWVRLTSYSSNERDKLLEGYIDQLHRKGTPPPPTQQERERRK